MQRTFWIRFATFVLWLFAAASAVYWGLKFVQGPAAPPSASAAVSSGAAAAVDSQAVAKGLGGGRVNAANSGANNPVAVPASSIVSSRFVLTGVVVDRAGASRSSVALIGVDGKPARPYRVGTSLVDGVVLHSVAAGKAMLATDMQTQPSTTLELPKLTSAVVGTAVAARPPQPAIPAPNPMAVPNAAANAMSAPGTRPPRPGANRQREGRGEDRLEKQANQPAAQEAPASKP
jgi:general secretion pathway protein C